MRDPALDEMDQILRDDLDEPPTCAEELERTVWPPAASMTLRDGTPYELAGAVDEHDWRL